MAKANGKANASDVDGVFYDYEDYQLWLEQLIADLRHVEESLDAKWGPDDRFYARQMALMSHPQRCPNVVRLRTVLEMRRLTLDADTLLQERATYAFVMDISLAKVDAMSVDDFTNDLALFYSSQGMVAAPGRPTEVRAQRIPLFPRGEDCVDRELVELIRKLESEGRIKPFIQIACEYYANYDDSKSRANKALSIVRNLRKERKTTLPPRAELLRAQDQ